METHVFMTFFIATTLMIAMPGPSVILTVAHSISYGWRPALATVGGATAGIAVQLIIAAIGLASVLQFISEAFAILRWVGAIYLIYLGIRQWQSANKPLEMTSPATSKKNLFVQGLIVTIPNPKSLIFIAAFLPQFIDTTRATWPQFIVLVPTFLFITFTVTSIWAISAGKAKTFLRRKNTTRSIFKAAGGMMIFAGLGLALARKSN